MSPALTTAASRSLPSPTRVLLYHWELRNRDIWTASYVVSADRSILYTWICESTGLGRTMSVLNDYVAIFQRY